MHNGGNDPFSPCRDFMRGYIDHDVIILPDRLIGPLMALRQIGPDSHS